MNTENKAKILLVDDRHEDLFSLEVVLRNNNNCEFIKANSGQEALKILLKEQDFAIILMDVQMPLMDGFETAELIRQSERLRNIPIIFLTASNNAPEKLFKGYEIGAVDYMLKPIVAEILRAKVSVFVDLYLKTKAITKMRNDLSALNKTLNQRTIALERSNKDLEKFAYVSSHDLQEPLRTITSYIQLLQHKLKGNLDSESQEFMNFVVGASTRMRNIIISLLEYSRINREQKDYVKVDTNVILNEVIENMYTTITTNNVKIETHGLPSVFADRTQMIQLFQNLIGNSIKFKKGEKDVEISVTAKEENGFYLFAVRDNGIGMEQKHEDKIFEMFQRLNNIERYPGTGIGLAICKKIIEHHGGKIWMESSPGKGTTFYFTISTALSSPSAVGSNSTIEKLQPAL